MLEWSEVAVQATPPAIVTRIVCGLVASEPLSPKFRTFRLTDKVGCTVEITVESLAVAVDERLARAGVAQRELERAAALLIGE